MLNIHVCRRVLFVLSLAPLLGGCSQDFWVREPKVAGLIERAAVVVGPPIRLAAGGLEPLPVAGVGSPDGSPAVPVVAPVAYVPATLGRDDLAVLDQVNRIRTQNGLGTLQFNDRLYRAARAHSDEQLRHNFLGHGSMDPERVKLSQRMLAEGYIGRIYAEVVARDYPTVDAVVRAWMDSPTHRAVLLDPELSEGAFCRVDASDGISNRWTGEFGAPDNSLTPLPAAAPSPLVGASPAASSPRSPAPSGTRAPTPSATPPRPAPPALTDTSRLGSPPAAAGLRAPGASGPSPSTPASTPPGAIRRDGAGSPAVAGAVTRPVPPPAPASIPAPRYPPQPAALPPPNVAGRVPPPAASVPAPRPVPAPQPTVVQPAPRYQPPAYVPPPVYQPRQPVIIRRPPRRVGDCAT